MKNKTDYLFGEKAYYEKSLNSFRKTESIYELFDNYYLQLDLIKYKLFGEIPENYGDLIINGVNYSPPKINIDFLEKHLKELNLFRKIFINDKRQQKEIKWKDPTKSDIKAFLKILTKKKLSPINFFKFKMVPSFTKKNNNSIHKNNLSLSSRNKLANSSYTNKSNLSSRIQNTSFNSFNEKNKLALSPIITCRHKLRTKLNNENNIIKEYNSFYFPYRKKCIQNNAYNIYSILKNKNKNKNGTENTIKKFDKRKYLKEMNDNNKKIERTLLIKNKINSLEKKVNISSNSFLYKILKRDEQKPQFKKRFKYLLSQYN